ncbi:MAG: zinc ribbon domain-containing protein [Anaerolineales bacterium]
MKPVWKWVIGIVVGLIVVAALVGVAFLVHAHLPFNAVTALHITTPGTGRLPQNNRTLPAPGTRQVPPGNQTRRFGTPGNGTPYYGMPGYGWRGRGMMGFGPMMFFMPFAGLLFVLGWLGWLVLLVLGIVWLVRRPREVQPAAVPALSACPRCGKPVQGDWSNCPYCGKKL